MRSGLLGYKTKTIPWFAGLCLTAHTVTLKVRRRRTGRPIQVSLSLTLYRGEPLLIPELRPPGISLTLDRSLVWRRWEKYPTAT